MVRRACFYDADWNDGSLHVDVAMTNTDKLIELFQFYGYKMTLGQLLAHPSGVGYKCTSRFSDLRKKGYKIDCIKAEKASDNLYVMAPPPDENGQMRFV